MIARREPKHQGKLAFALLGALAVVVFGTLIGSYLGIHGVLEGTVSNWLGLQGFEYLDACTELTHTYLRILEAYSKQNVDLQLRSRRWTRRKKKKAAGKKTTAAGGEDG